MDTAASQRVWVRLWGEFRILDGTGQPIEITSRKARALFALLATVPEATVSRDRLAAMLWGDRSDAHARASLRQLFYELKSLASGPSPILGFDRRGAWLEPHFELDTDAQLRMDPTDLAMRLPARDVVFLADLDGISEEFDEWLSTARASAEAQLRQLVQKRLDTALAQGAALDARALADAWCARDPTDETIAQSGLRADAALGDASRFARRLRNLEGALATELGVKLSAATVALAHELAPRLRTPAAAPESRTLPRATPPVPAPVAVAATREQRLVRLLAATALCIAAAGAVAWRAIDTEQPGTAEAARLTASARELTHGRARAGIAQAAAQARRAIAADPRYAPAWAELALAEWLPPSWSTQCGPAARAEVKAKVLGYLDRALALDPHLGRALAVRGMVLGGSEGKSLLDAGVRQAPNDAESWLWLANARIEEGNVRAGLAAAQRAAQLDPLWDRSVGAYVGMAAELGDPPAVVDGVLDRFAAASPNRFVAESMRASVARIRGDLVAAARHGALALAVAPDDPWLQIADLATVARAVGDVEGVRRLTSLHEGLRPRLASVFDPEGAIARAQGDAELWWQSFFVEDDARALLRAGRADLLLGLVEGQPRPLLEVVGGVRDSEQVPLAALVAVALRRAGRRGEAEPLVGAIRAEVGRVVAGGTGHYVAFDLAEALAFALDDRNDAAVAALDRAAAGGWRGQLPGWAVDPGDEPAFAGLRGRPDFERVRARLAAERESMRPQVVEICAHAPVPKLKLAASDER